jgi:tetratricopeptide (TPR) repeat protein
MSKTSLILVSLVFSCLAFSSKLKAADKTKKEYVETKDEKLHRETLQLIDDLILGKMQLKTLEAKIKSFKKKDEQKKAFWLYLLARYERMLEDDPNAALEILGKTFLKEETLTEWLAAEKTAKKEGLAAWKKACQEARKNKKAKPAQPLGLFADFPKPEDWVLSKSNAYCAIEAGYVLMACQKYPEAMAVFAYFGGDTHSYDFLAKALGGEGAGDIFVKVMQYEKALSFYKYGLSRLKTAAEGGEQFSGWSPELIYLKKRMQKKLTIAERLYRIEQFGKGQVVFCEADTFRRKNKNYVLAYLKYEDLLQEFEKTIYGEVAKCHQIKCLLELSTKAGQENLRETIKAETKKTRELARKYEKGKANKAPKKALAKLKDALTLKEEYRKILYSFPVGAKAEKKAEELATVFLQENEFGLWRGEVLFDLGNYALENSLSIKNAQKWFGKADAWFAVIKEKDKGLDVFSVPNKAKEISAPPPEERETDLWGNVKFAEVKPGQIFNRHTSPWYCINLQKQLKIYLGFLAYVEKDYDTAGKIWGGLALMDKHYAASEKRGFGSAVTRLLWNAKYNKGSLFGTAEEMKPFAGAKVRLAVLLADLCIETDYFVKGGERYEAILAGKYGALTTDQKAYVSFGLSVCYMYQMNFKKKIALFDKFDIGNEFGDSPPAPRVWMTRACRLVAGVDKDKCSRGIKYLEQVIKRLPKAELARDALFFIGKSLHRQGYNDEALIRLNEYLEKFPDDGWGHYAKKRVAEIKASSKSK